MKRFAAQWVYCNPQQIIAKGVVELDDVGLVKAVFSLHDKEIETHSTAFYNGIIIPRILSDAIIESNVGESIWEVLEKEFLLKEVAIKVGETVNLCLLEPLDLVKLKILPETKMCLL